MNAQHFGASCRVAGTLLRVLSLIATVSASCRWPPRSPAAVASRVAFRETERCLSMPMHCLREMALAFSSPRCFLAFVLESTGLSARSLLKTERRLPGPRCVASPTLLRASE